MIKILTTKRYRQMLAEIEELRRQLVEENRAKHAALKRLAELVSEKQRERQKAPRKRS